MSNQITASGKWLPSHKVMEAAKKQIDSILKKRFEKSNKYLDDMIKEKNTWFYKAPKTREEALKIVENGDKFRHMSYYHYKTQWAANQLDLCIKLINLCNHEQDEDIYITVNDFYMISNHYDKETIMIRNN